MDELDRIKRKLQETIQVKIFDIEYYYYYIINGNNKKKVNESLSKGFIRAKKKIKTLVFERK